MSRSRGIGNRTRCRAFVRTLRGALAGALACGAAVASAGAWASASAQQPYGAGERAADSVAALEAFRGNIAAIHGRDRAAYLSHYLRSPALARAGAAGVQHGYEGLAAGAGDSWPDTLVATHFQVTPLAPGVVWGAYRYRVLYPDGTEGRGVSERVLVRTGEGWRIAVTTAFDAPPELPPPPFALVGATLIDGTGSPPLAGAVVLMRDGRIACAGPASECPVPDDAAPIDATGKWIIPGLVDAHVHYSQTGWADGRPDALDLRSEFPYDVVVRGLRDNPELFFRSYLCSGVTTTFDVGGYPWSWELRAAGEGTRAPNVAAAGPLLSTRPWLRVPASSQYVHLGTAAATREAVGYLAANRSDAAKLWFVTPAGGEPIESYYDRMGIMGQEAAAAGLPFLVHATSLVHAKEALRAGATLLVHSVQDAPVDDEFLELMRSNDAVITPTLMVFDGYTRLGNRELDEGAETLECVDPATRARVLRTTALPGGVSAEDRRRRRALTERQLRLLQANMMRIHDAGLTVALGTDAGNPLTLHGPAVFRELEAMQEAGMSPAEVLVAATRNGARALGWQDRIGTVEAGKLADLVVLDADPLADIANVRAISLVVRRGEPRTRAELEFRHDAAEGSR